MKYKELNLKKIREDNDLDFAHYTYKKGMCSCCYWPTDLASIYWKNRTKRDDDNYEYILFKNADNGSGHVTREDEIKGNVCISWRFDPSKLRKVCKDLQEQLGDDYSVLVPPNDLYTIVIHQKIPYSQFCSPLEEYLKDGYTLI